ncbi:beta-ketoacyl synthase chain length factor [Aestuariicella hydrocarbonica]|uniref:Beta-ketoacyl synthase chain length factor n=1 Tax=Pseudomaricurvus hydrocarbonicus TaxID=1470433 RepID=A0A9E5MLX5_9GAMM|nr:beta-ketoacyl synthase chain length factor [Aestuariicella hydrocarbonica]NHO64910.1 beta-ketoacyl synthase chain length factor [Aestuariicella hydrocarbonica]
MSSLTISVTAWSAWAPGLNTPEHWQQWAAGQRAIGGEEKPSVAEIPAMLRRRLSPLGKMALATAMPLLASRADTPCVLVSRHGDLTRTLGLLNDLAHQQELSPTHFSLSVHNAIGGLLSITRKDPSNVTALACGLEDVSTGLMEAQAILQEQASLRQRGLLPTGNDESREPATNEVLCVIYDEPVPAVYAHTRESNQPILPHYPYAVAFLLTQGATDSRRYHLQVLPPAADSPALSPSERAAPPINEPQAISLLRWMLTAHPPSELLLPGTRNTWQWSQVQS